MFQLASKIDYTHVEILNLYKKRINLQQREESATVCGWGTGDEYRYSSFGNVKYSANLHCTSILVYSEKTCVRVIPSGDYQRKLLCGQAKNQEEVTTLVITLWNLSIHLILRKYIKYKQFRIQNAESSKWTINYKISSVVSSQTWLCSFKRFKIMLYCMHLT